MRGKYQQERKGGKSGRNEVEDKRRGRKEERNVGVKCARMYVRRCVGRESERISTREKKKEQKGGKEKRYQASKRNKEKYEKRKQSEKCEMGKKKCEELKDITKKKKVKIF